ncbi:Methyltransferase [[Actinomadura] parvosata subsp. kistnae]|uniref:SAM-dependent methyltransferase n=1 Tax=[Actinomadura] parvosata subsp. kistnae TaxID=1909395 RepID=A0A1U9ZXX3_9ACTN|nr:class I SAM-dependent methyltransferase [Nonomuraea sp. ATCC 55076]AQZ62802.1 SAM-dependent methyltransferase [Nonomuraea sp. ATCC 55076]SPL98327.1 Methyltransferase [Actinomadura parvosata subsp. kistnae]
MKRTIRTIDDVLALMDTMFAAGADRWTGNASTWWDGFYADRSKPVPFFVAGPDESLASYVERGLLAPGRALDLGCGPGRNAVFLASRGFEVDAVDLSPAAVTWGRERAQEAGVRVRFVCGDAFTAPELAGPYDLVYDSGCLHHLPPHRRVSYRALLERVLAPGGHLGVTCFAAGRMGSDQSDEELYRDGELHGGLAYTPEELRWLFADYTEVELRPMTPQPPGGPLFGADFLLSALFSRTTAA